MMNKFFLHGKLTAKAGEGERLKEILIKASELVSKVKGCQMYLISLNKGEPEAIYVTEIWDTKEDHQNSLKNEEVKNLIMSAIPILDGMPTGGQELEFVGGFGL